MLDGCAGPVWQDVHEYFNFDESLVSYWLSAHSDWQSSKSMHLQYLQYLQARAWNVHSRDILGEGGFAKVCGGLSLRSSLASTQ